MRCAVTGTGNTIEAGEEPFNIRGLAFGAGNAVVGGSKDKLFKFRFAFQTFVFKNRHGFLPSPFPTT